MSAEQTSLVSYLLDFAESIEDELDRLDHGAAQVIRAIMFDVLVAGHHGDAGMVKEGISLVLFQLELETGAGATLRMSA